MANDASSLTTSALQLGLGNRVYHSRAPSRSPTRLSELQNRDGLLSDLTPATILQALSSTAVFQSNEHRPLNSLEASIVKASSTEKVFCIKAAVASNKLREWNEEVAGWEWPSAESSSDTSKGFEVPSLEERKAKRRKLHRYEHDAYGSANALNILGHPKARSASQMRDIEDDLEFWGCLPVEEAIRCDERVRQIEAELDGLELDDLKEHVLDVHVTSRSRPSSSYERDVSVFSSLHNRLDDCTTVTTAVVLQALPELSKLSRMLNTWAVRLSVLRQAPKFLADLEDAKHAQKLGWDAIGIQPQSQAGSKYNEHPPEHNSSTDTQLGSSFGPSTERKASSDDLTSQDFQTIREVLEEKVTSSGQQLDSILDALEGRNETVPSHWIEELELMEATYSDWVVEAEKKVLENQWRRQEKARASQTLENMYHVPKLGTSSQEQLSLTGASFDGPANMLLEPLSNPDTRSPAGSSAVETALGNKPCEQFEEEISSNVVESPFLSATTSLDQPCAVALPAEGAFQSKDSATEELSIVSNTCDNLTDHVIERGAADVGNAVSSQLPVGQVVEQSGHIPNSATMAPMMIDEPSSRLQTAFALHESEGSIKYLQGEAGETKRSQLEDGNRILPDVIDSPILEEISPHSNQRGLAASPVEETHKSSNAHQEDEESPPEKHIADEALMPNQQAAVEKNATAPTDIDRNIDLISHSPTGKPKTKPLTGSIDLSDNLLPKSDYDSLAETHKEKSEISTPASSISGYFSNLPSPDIEDASATEYFKPVIVASPLTSIHTDSTEQASTLSRNSSQRTERYAEDNEDECEPFHSPVQPFYARSRSTSLLVDLTIPELREDEDYSEHSKSTNNQPLPRLTRSSRAYTMPPQRAEIRQIEIKRAGSISPVSPTPSSSQPFGLGMHTPTSAPLSPWPTPNGVAVSPVSVNEVETTTEEQSPSVRQYERRLETSDIPVVSIGSPPVPERSTRRRQGNSVDIDKRSPSPEKQQNKATAASIEAEDEYPLSNISSPRKTIEDHLEEKISSILTTIPARIRLTTEKESKSPSARESHKGLDQPRRPLQASRSSTASPSFTLARATAKMPRARHQSNNPDIKLYHLHRSSDEAPIKLFVRLVGESERVMVRVGGGWADLGEYLREYAAHHGRRSTSDGRVEIQEPPRLKTRPSLASLNTQTGRATPTNGSRPGSALSRPSSSLSVGRMRPHEASPALPSPNLGNRSRRLEMTPPVPTPPSASANSFGLRPSSRRSSNGTQDEEFTLGLAGPRSRKSDISAEKQAWVEGMIGQVRKASAEKKAEWDFGDLGKVGGSRRLFRKSDGLRPGSRADSRAESRADSRADFRADDARSAGTGE